MVDSLANWIAPDGAVLPDFIICGAMKSGTTSLHHILNQHPDVFIPKREIHFFDIDNLFQHPDFSFYGPEGWTSPAIATTAEHLWEWYSSQFDGSREGQVLGEDSTTYLASEIAAKRIAAQPKSIKLIVMLRHPTKRAYSQYWHMLRTGRVCHTFEDTLRYNPHSVLERSMYQDQLQRLFAQVPRERVNVILFEDFLDRRESVVQDTCRHVEIDPSRLPARDLDAHRNPSRVPKYPAVQRLRNWLSTSSSNRSYASYLPNMSIDNGTNGTGPEAGSRLAQAVERVHRRLNPLTRRRPPEMQPETRRFLDHYFRRELAGLPDLLGRDVISFWFGAGSP